MRRIALIAFLAIFAFAGVVLADQQVTFQWDDVNSPAPEGYRLYIRDQAGNYDYAAPAYDGAVKTFTMTLADGNWAAVVRAYVGTNQSGNSNEVIFSVSPQPPAVIVPGRPQQLIINFQ